MATDIALLVSLQGSGQDQQASQLEGVVLVGLPHACGGLSLFSHGAGNISPAGNDSLDRRLLHEDSPREAAVPDWQALLDSHGPMVHRTARRILGRDADAEDVVQEVFLEVFQRQALCEARNLPGLLHRMATFRALDLLRSRKPSARLDPFAVSAGEAPEQAAVARELAARLRLALSELSKQQAAVFCLRYFDERSYEEIAGALGITTGAVGVSLHKARSRLGELLSEPANQQ